MGSAAPDSLPHVIIKVESASIYFCDHGGPREAVAWLFRRVVDEALTLSDGSDRVTLTAL